MRRKSSGTTTVASPERKAWVRQKCEVSPTTPSASVGTRRSVPSRNTNSDGPPWAATISGQASARGSWIMFIQKITAKVETRLVSCLVTMSEIAKAKAANSTTSDIGWELAEPAPGHALAEHEGCEQRHPGRRGEFQREHGGKRQHRDGQRPGVLAGEMRGVAGEVIAHVARRDLASELRPRRDQR